MKVDSDLVAPLKAQTISAAGNNEARLDPYKMEMALDLLPAAKGKKAGQVDQDPAVTNLLAYLAEIILDFPTNAQPGVVETFKLPSSYSSYESGVNAATPQSSRNDWVKLFAQVFTVAMGGKVGGDGAQYWLRPGKYTPTVEEHKHGATAKLDSELIDRALYKASNFPGLVKANETAIPSAS